MHLLSKQNRIIISQNYFIKVLFVFSLIINSAFVSANDNLVYSPAKVFAIADLATGQIVEGKNIFIPMQPASMSKLMTLAILLKKINSHEIKLTDRFLVSKNASQKGGSKMFVRDGSKVKVEDLIRGIIIQSGNDASIVVAENIAGTEENFASLMNYQAKEIGLNNSFFTNATGWPDEKHVMSGADIIKLAYYIWTSFPQFQHYFKEKSFTYSGITQRNRNPLFGKVEGVIGMKTGHTEASGFGMVVIAQRESQGRIVMFHGLSSKEQRELEGTRLVNIAFNSFKKTIIFDVDDVVHRQKLFMARQSYINLGVETRAEILTHLDKEKHMPYSIEITTPLPVPLKKGSVVGRLVIASKNDKYTFPLVTQSDVNKPSVLDRLSVSFSYVMDKLSNHQQND